MGLLKKLLRQFKPKPKTLISELSVDKLTAGTLTATVRVAEPLPPSYAMLGSAIIPAYTLASMTPAESHGKTVSWCGLVDGEVRDLEGLLEAATVKDDGTIELRIDHGTVYLVGPQTIIHLSTPHDTV